jgi:hypothetical protein
MAKREGIRRMTLAGRLVMLVGLTCTILAYVGMGVLIFGLVLVPIGGLLWLAGWIVDGFNQPDS